METWEWIVLAAAVVAALLLAIALVRIRTRRSHLKERFGMEYQRAVADQTGRRGVAPQRDRERAVPRQSAEKHAMNER